MTTPNLGMTKPTVGADADNWGTELNANLDLIDTRCAKIGFSAYLSAASQSLPNATQTKVQLDAEQYDVGGYFDSTTNYRFTPGVAGYYQFSWRVDTPASLFVISVLWKNGVLADGKRGQPSAGGPSVGSGLVYMNGTTDYVELYVYQQSGGSSTIGGPDGATSYLTGFLVFPA